MGDDLARDRADGVARDGEADPGAAPPSSGSEAASVGMPITAPVRSTSAPPLLPGLIGALVWITAGSATPPPSGTVRLDRADDALGHARAQAERVADGERDVADPNAGGVARTSRARPRAVQLMTARSLGGNCRRASRACRPWPA